MLKGLVVVGALLLAGCASEDGTSVSKEQYNRWKAECSQRATAEVEASDGIYRVGGNHWVDSVNDCLVTKAGD